MVDMMGLFGNLNNTLNNLPLSGNLGLLTTGVGLLEGQPIGQAVRSGLQTYQGLSSIDEERKRKALMQKLVSDGNFTEREKALIAATPSQNQAAVIQQINARKAAAANKPPSTAKGADGFLYFTSGPQMGQRVLPGVTGSTPEPKTAQDADGFLRYTTGPQKGERVFPDAQGSTPEPKTAKAADGFLYYTSGPQKGERVFPDAQNPPSDERTNLIKNFEFFKTLKPDASDEEVMQYLKGGNTFNLGPDVQVKGDFAITKDPSAPNGLRFTVIPNSPTDLKQQAAAQKESKITSSEQAKTEAEATSGTLVLEEIDRAIAAIKANPRLTTGLGAQFTQNIDGTPAVDLSELLSPIQANIGFDRLQRMRNESPTGGALGQVAVKELDFLQATQGSLSQRQNSPQLLENLERLGEQYKASMLRIYRAALKAQQDGDINNVTNEIIDPLDYFSQSEIDMLTSSETQPQGSFAERLSNATTVTELNDLAASPNLTPGDRDKIMKKLEELF